MTVMFAFFCAEVLLIFWSYVSPATSRNFNKVLLTVSIILVYQWIILLVTIANIKLSGPPIY
jgi:hypothetical protein